MKLNIETSPAFSPLLKPARYKGAFGGRGSGKSHFFAELLVESHLLNPGFNSVCIREVQKTLRDSSKRLIEDKINKYGLLNHGFRILNDRIEAPGGGAIIFIGMADHNAESIKSLEGFNLSWTEEAQTLSKHSLMLLRPTIRATYKVNKLPELWFSWNPRRKSDAVDHFFRSERRTKSMTIVNANWSDNPWFPEVLDDERISDLEHSPDSYDHVWQGGYVTTQDGAYFAKQIAKAKLENRITIVPRDQLMSTHSFFDIGGTGAKSDAVAIWVVQFIRHQIIVIDYYEAQGQELSEHVGWLRRNRYDDTNIYLPHDGLKHDYVFKVTYESELKKAGFKVKVLPNAGAGAVNQRIEAVRRIFPKVWIDKEKCNAGLEALGWYHEKIDEHRGVGLGAEHDWSSHAADAFGAMALEASKINMDRPLMIKTMKSNYNVFS